ncbi:MAG: hypothetical protein FJW23_03290 [Acidimicrobiia bacterium]|nr:hypothetical protein [Acidimicrobiia bacterium]
MGSTGSAAGIGTMVAVVATFGAAAQGQAGPGDRLATVEITRAVRANGAALPPGTYDLRLTGEHPNPLPGQTREAQVWVEFVRDGQVAGREVAQVLQDSDLPQVGASAAHAAEGTTVALLRGGEFLRVSVKQESVRYLVYLALPAR